MIFVTETIVETANSDYEIDTKNKLIRLIRGNPTPRFGARGRWHRYEELVVYGENHLSPLEIGYPMAIRWPDGQPELRDHSVTTPVCSIKEPERPQECL